MKRLFTAMVGMILVLTAQAEVILVDFGTTNSYRGASVSTPDESGRYWNGFAIGDILTHMVDSTGKHTCFDLAFTTTVATDSHNGPAGLTSNPPTPGEIANTVFDAPALGELGATNAVFDYVGAPTGQTARFTLSNLDPVKRYTLTFFGSRKYPTGELPDNDASRTTRYTVTDAGGAPLVTTTLVVGRFDSHNTNMTAQLTGVAPGLDNAIHVEFSGLTPTNAGYLNCMKIELMEPAPLPPSDQTILIDLGNDSSYRGASVANPDDNSNNWNSVWSGAYYTNLIDADSNTTTVGLGFDAATGSDSYNGPSGVIDKTALGLLGGSSNAANDYYVSSSFRITGLDPNKTYALTFFGSHKYSTDDATVYSLHTDSGYTGQVAAASLNVQTPGSPEQHNSNTVVSVTNLSPQADNALYVKFQGNQGGNGYLNALRIDVYHEYPTYRRWALEHRISGGAADDDDTDGLSNLGEYAFGGNPTNSADTGYPTTCAIVDLEGTNYLMCAYVKRSGNVGMSYYLELCPDLLTTNWVDSGYTVVATGAVSSLMEAVTNLVPVTNRVTFVRTVVREP